MDFLVELEILVRLDYQAVLVYLDCLEAMVLQGPKAKRDLAEFLELLENRDHLDYQAIQVIADN